MTYRGTVHDGRVIIEEGARLPDGAMVEIVPLEPEPDPADGLLDEAVETGIPDLASQHDHYIYGVPKREP